MQTQTRWRSAFRAGIVTTSLTVGIGGALTLVPVAAADEPQKSTIEQKIIQSSDSGQVTRRSSGGTASASSSGSAGGASFGGAKPNKDAFFKSPGDSAGEPRVKIKRTGSRTITTVDQDDRTIVISESPSRISVQIIKHDDDDDAKPEAYAAPNAQALRAKHPAAYALYEKHVLNQRTAKANGGNVGGLGLGGLGGFGGALPGGGIAGGVVEGNGELPPEARQMLEQQLREVLDKVDSPELKRLIEDQLRDLKP